MVKVSPSILSANFACLGQEVQRLEQAGADYVHIDVMDGQFVPNLTFGAPVVRDIRPATTLPFDVHLMIEKPENLIPDFVKAGADFITVHAEACTHLHRVLQMIQEQGKKAGVALNPATPPEMIQYVLKNVDLVLLMTVNPGFGGQPFIAQILPKIRRVRQMLEAAGSQAMIEVDGGVNAQTGLACVQAGANMLVAGSYIFAAENDAELKNRVHTLKNL